MGNKQGKENKHRKQENQNLSIKAIKSLINGFAHQYLNKSSVVPMEIVILCCEFYGSAVLKQLTLPSLSVKYGQCNGHYGKIYSISFKKDTCLTASQDGKPILWNIAHPDSIVGMAAPSPLNLFSTKNNKGKNKNKRVYHFHKLATYTSDTAFLITCALSKVKSYICWGGLDNQLQVIKFGTTHQQGNAYQIIHRMTLSGFEDGYTSYVTFMDDIDEHDYVLIASGDNNCYAFDLKDPAIDLNDTSKPCKTWKIATAEIMRCDYYQYKKDQIMIAFVSVDQYLYIADFNADENSSYLAKIHISEIDVNCMDFSENGTMIVTGSDDGCVRLYDISSINWNNMKTLGELMNASSYNNGVKLLCTFDNRELLKEQDVKVEGTRITDTRFVGNKCIIVGCNSGKVFYIKITDEEYQWGELITGHNQRVSQFSVDGNILMIASWDKTATAHDLSSLLN